MRLKKIKRKLFKKLPYFLFSSLLIFSFAAAAIFFAKNIISKHNFFVSPLAQGKVEKEGSLEALLYKNNIQFSKVQTASDSANLSYIVFLRDQGEVYLGSKNLPSQISSLQLILSRLTIEGKKFKKLDLRFDKPIIEF